MGSSELSAAIKALRIRIGLTQEELAEKAGISVRTISDAERGLRRSVYRDTAERLADALEVEPSERPGFIAAARGRRRPASEVPGDPARRPQGRGAIPVPPTPLIGREAEMELLLRTLGEPSIRAVTLLGPGGVGKTRLAVESAVLARHLFEGGVFFLQLSAVEDTELVLPAIADALGLSDRDIRDAHDLAVESTSDRSLVILDTFEHLLGAAPLVGEILSLTPAIHVLIASRQALGIRGEHTIPIQPLDLPAPGSVDLASSASGRLLLDRALAVKPDLIIDERSSAVLSDICRRLDGLPLAIELAASRIRHFPLVTLLEQLDSRLSILNKGAPDLPPRQRTMRDTIAWGYDLLSEREQKLFRALSVFRGGWTFEALTAVCAPPDVDAGEILNALIDKSLVVVTATQEGEPRYSMMDLLGEFASEKAEVSGEMTGLSRRHAEHFLTFAEEAERHLGTQDQEGWFYRLRLDHDNLRSALRWSIKEREVEVGIRLAASLWQFWRAQGHLAEGREWLEKTLAAAPDAPLEVRARALWGASWLAFPQDDLRAVRRYVAELSEIHLQEEPSIMHRNALTLQAMLAMAEGDHSAGLSPLEQSVEICSQVGSPWLLATSKMNLGLVCLHLRRLPQAAEVLEEADALFAELGDPRFMARVCAYRGHLELLREDISRAKASFTEALHRFEAVADRSGMAESLEGLAAALSAEDLHRPSALLWGAASRWRSRDMSKMLPFERALLDHWLDKTHSALGSVSWHAALSQGADVDPEKLLAEVGIDLELL